MRAALTLTLLVCLLALTSSTSASHIRIDGIVTQHWSGRGMPNALIRLYRNGEKVHAEHTAANGKFAFQLQNNAQYIIRVSAPGHVTKCFQIETFGLSWTGDQTKCELKVEMTMLEQLEGLDLSFFDMPLGLATFQPSTGYLAWSKEYEAQIAPRVAQLMQAYHERLSMMAVLQDR